MDPAFGEPRDDLGVAVPAIGVADQRGDREGHAHHLAEHREPLACEKLHRFSSMLHPQQQSPDPMNRESSIPAIVPFRHPENRSIQPEELKDEADKGSLQLARSRPSSRWPSRRRRTP
jgi:hypothetical protein